MIFFNNCFLRAAVAVISLACASSDVYAMKKRKMGDGPQAEGPNKDQKIEMSEDSEKKKIADQNKQLLEVLEVLKKPRRIKRKKTKQPSTSKRQKIEVIDLSGENLNEDSSAKDLKEKSAFQFGSMSSGTDLDGKTQNVVNNQGGTEEVVSVIKLLGKQLVEEVKELDQKQAALIEDQMRKMVNQTQKATGKKRSRSCCAQAASMILSFPQFCVASVLKISNFADVVVSKQSLISAKNCLVRLVKIMILTGMIVVAAESALWGASTATASWFGWTHNFKVTLQVVDLFMNKIGLPVSAYVNSGALQEAVAGIFGYSGEIIQTFVRYLAKAAGGIGLVAGEGFAEGAGQAVLDNPLAAAKIGLAYSSWNVITISGPLLVFALLKKKLVG